MDDKFISIETFLQAGFRLHQGKILCAKIDDAMVYIEEKDQKVFIHVQPKFGSVEIAECPVSAFENIFSEMLSNGVKFYWCEEGTLNSRKSNIIDRFADFIRRQM